jgi:hypothetical protein
VIINTNARRRHDRDGGHRPRPRLQVACSVETAVSARDRPLESNVWRNESKPVSASGVRTRAFMEQFAVPPARHRRVDPGSSLEPALSTIDGVQVQHDSSGRAPSNAATASRMIARRVGEPSSTSIIATAVTFRIVMVLTLVTPPVDYAVCAVQLFNSSSLPPVLVSLA